MRRGAMRRARWGGGQWEGGSGEGRRGKRTGISQMDMMEFLGEADRMLGVTDAMAFTDSYKHMECLG